MIEQNYTLAAFNYNVFTEELGEHALKQKIISIKYEGTSLTFYLVDETSASEIVSLTQFVTDHTPSNYAPYRILALVNPEFNGHPLENIDFKRHLPGNIALNKVAIMLADGRPGYADYDLDGVKIARIEFVFETDSSNLMTNRKEYLRYYKTNDALSEQFLIKSKIYSPATNEKDAEDVVEERVRSRGQIMSGLKASVSGFLMFALSKNMNEVIDLVKGYYGEADSLMSQFKELGSTGWKDSLIAMDLTTTPHTWFAIEMAPGYTVRDHFVAKLSY